MKKRISLLAMSLVLVLAVFTVSASAAVYEPEFADEAEVLYDLGLFRGTGVNEDGTPIFALEKGNVCIVKAASEHTGDWEKEGRRHRTDG